MLIMNQTHAKENPSSSYEKRVIWVELTEQVFLFAVHKYMGNFLVMPSTEMPLHRDIIYVRESIKEQFKTETARKIHKDRDEIHRPRNE